MEENNTMNINQEENTSEQSALEMYNKILDEEIEFKAYDILGMCALYLQDPSNEQYQALFIKLQNNLLVKEYLPLFDKELILRKALIDIRTVDTEAYTLSSAFEIALTFDCLLAYTNIDPNISKDLKDREFYDLLLLSGLYDYIYEFCCVDYDRLMRMADRMLSWDNLKVLLKEIESTTPENVDELTKAFKEFTTNTDPEKLRLYGNILAGEDPLLNQIKQKVEDSAYQTMSKLNLQNKKDEE